MKKIIAGLLLVGALALASQTVYIVPNGKKYHGTKSCRSLSRSKNIQAVSITKVGGRGPCGICKP